MVRNNGFDHSSAFGYTGVPSCIKDITVFSMFVKNQLGECYSLNAECLLHDHVLNPCVQIGVVEARLSGGSHWNS